MADREHQRFGIPQPDAAAPHRRQRQDQGFSRQNSKHLPAIISHNLGASGGFFRSEAWTQRSWLTPGAWLSVVKPATAPERGRKYLKKNDNFLFNDDIRAPAMPNQLVGNLTRRTPIYRR